MRRHVSVLTFLAAMSLEGPAGAEAPKDGKQPLICRAAKQSLGSRIRTPRRCKTAEQWAAEDEAAGRVPISLRVNQSQNDGTQKRSQ
jgi:hypothetical protein